MQERDERDDDPGDGRAREWNQVEERDDQAQRDRIRHAHDQQDDGDRGAGDEADQDVAGDVAADRPVDLVADSTPARLRLLGEERVRALNPGAPLEQHEERQEDDRHRRAMIVMMLLVIVSAAPESPSTFFAPPF